MNPLSNITGLPPEAAELLAAAGVRSPEQLARQTPVSLHPRLELLAWQRGRAIQVPSVEQLEQWVAAAIRLNAAGAAESMSLDDIPEALPESTYTPPGGARTPPALRTARETTGGTQNGSGPGFRQGAAAGSAHDLPYTPPAPRMAEEATRRLDPSRFISMEDYNEGRTAVQPLSRSGGGGSRRRKAEVEPEMVAEEPPAEVIPRRAQRIRSKGEDLSRWVRRGVVHPRPLHTWLGAVISVVWRLSLVAALAGVVWLITQVETPSQYQTEVITGAGILVVLGCMQLHFAGRSRCRICSCNLFYSKNCHKNRKAHLIPGFGYVASLSLHLLIFRWFRCMYCGTAVRLKGDK